MNGQREWVSLKSYNSLGIPAQAKAFHTLTSEAAVSTYFRQGQEEPVMILGGGSNVLFVDDYDGIVLHNKIQGKTIDNYDADHVLVRAGAGESWHDFVQWCIQQNLGGLENLSLIPGKVGAAPIQNIGAYGVEIKDVFHSLRAFDLEHKKFVHLDHKDCDFSYRSSRFKTEWKGRFLITSVQFKLSKKKHQLNTSYGAIEAALEPQMPITIKSIADAVIRIRQSKLPDPKELGNAGSFFKNPVLNIADFEKIKVFFPKMPHYPNGENLVKVPAGWLIDQCGWKGKRVGNTGCYEKQALVIVNYGNASGLEIWNFAQEVAQSVQTQFNIILEPEVNIIGAK